MLRNFTDRTLPLFIDESDYIYSPEASYCFVTSHEWDHKNKNNGSRGKPVIS